MKLKDLTGKTFNWWTPLEYAGSKGWVCQCKCGAVKIVQTGNLTSGRSKSCRQCSSGVEVVNKLPEGEAACNEVISHYKQAARIRSLSWELSREEAKTLFLGLCAYCGAAPANVLRTRSVLNGSFVYNGIDRVDSDLGYSANNCVPACKICNYMKRCLSVDEFKTHILRIVEHMEAL